MQGTAPKKKRLGEREARRERDKEKTAENNPLTQPEWCKHKTHKVEYTQISSLAVLQTKYIKVKNPNK